jgi:hypothetical protein
VPQLGVDAAEKALCVRRGDFDFEPDLVCAHRIGNAVPAQRELVEPLYIAVHRTLVPDLPDHVERRTAEKLFVLGRDVRARLRQQQGLDLLAGLRERIERQLGFAPSLLAVAATLARPFPREPRP